MILLILSYKSPSDQSGRQETCIKMHPEPAKPLKQPCVDPPMPPAQPTPEALTLEQPPRAEQVRQRPVLFGEVLFDCFEDGSEVLGGAPFNVAWHLKGWGLNPLLISRIGDDVRGNQVRKAMRQWGLTDQGLQTDASRPTGEVSVSMVDGEPRFDIGADQAYDHVDAASASRAVAHEHCALLYHGTLALRASPSAEVVPALQETVDMQTFLDLNLREPWWTEELVGRTLAAATWLKLNENELALVTRTAVNDDDARRGGCNRLIRDHGLASVFLTRGADGAGAVLPDGRFDQVKPTPVVNMVDPVGAGDAFSSVVLLGLIQEWTPDLILDRAVHFAAEICCIRGATTFDRNLYERCLAAWRKDHGRI